MWNVVYRESIRKDLKLIDKKHQKLIRKTIEEKLMIDPVKFGKLLRRTLKGLKKLRVGDYRIIYSVSKKIVTVEVIKVGHRREVYSKPLK